MASSAAPIARVLSAGGWTVRASSVLQRNSKLYGPRLALDSSADTCWSSDSGSPQWLSVEFPSPIDVSSISLVFQGGFVGQRCRLDALMQRDSIGDTDGGGIRSCGGASGTLSAEPATIGATRVSSNSALIAEFEPDDTNAEQSFGCCALRATKLVLTFGSSTDFYGRVVVYQLHVVGVPSACTSGEAVNTHDRAGAAAESKSDATI